jgi:hypothetical protein
VVSIAPAWDVWRFYRLFLSTWISYLISSWAHKMGAPFHHVVQWISLELLLAQPVAEFHVVLLPCPSSVSLEFSESWLQMIFVKVVKGWYLSRLSKVSRKSTISVDSLVVVITTSSM